MRINLDYYRILSVPIKANSSQLERAYEDRIRQQPRRDYSKSAIAMRKKLLTKAFRILNNSEKRSEYDRTFLEPSTPQTFKNQVANLSDSSSTQTPKLQAQTSELKQAISPNSQVKPTQSLETEEIVSGLSPIPTEPYLEIEAPLVIGALIILHELAEYEKVINIGHDYLKQEANSGSVASRKYSSEGVLLNEQDTVNASTESPKYPLRKADQYTKKAIKQEEARADTIFCIALSCLEISREKWRRQEWEKAAAYGDQGLKILQQESPSFFPHLQAEIQSELNLLKPYRILHLLEHNTIGSKLRSRGLKLLQEVLAQRNGIEGSSIDSSGLKSDQFLYFIQQIRNYLTLQEQKELFLVESRRGSHPGSCIAAYALIAEGFACKKPSSVMQANDILINLGQHQNTHWERAICALLLGQAEESQEVIEQIRQDSTYALIKKRSHDSPDLLPGLCFYGEQWLNKEVLSQFQDLKSNKITLSEYFNDHNVQAYLDTIAPITYKSQAHNASEISNNNQIATTDNSAQADSEKSHQQRSIKKGIFSLLPWLGNETKSSKVKYSQEVDHQDLRQQNKASQALGNSAPAYSAPAVNQKYRPETTLAEQTRAYAKAQQNILKKNTPGAYPSTTVSRGRYQNMNLPNSQDVNYGNSIQKTFSHHGKGGNTAVKTRQTDGNGNDHDPANKPYGYKATNPKRRSRSSSSSNKFFKNSLFLIALVAGLGTLSFLFTRVQISNNSNKRIGEQSKVSERSRSQVKTGASTKPQLTPEATKADPSATAETSGERELATASPQATKPKNPESNALNQNTAKQFIQKWLDGKKAALGKSYQADQLDKILTGQMLNRWKQTSLHYKQNKVHRQLSHAIKVRSVKLDPNKPNVASVEAEVTEVAKHYESEKLNQSQSYDDNLLVRYSLVKQNDSWLINGSEVIKNL